MDRITLAPGIELDVVDEGPRDAPALIFLHGFPESHRSWMKQVAHFSGRYRCIAPDQRGYQGSSKPEEVEAYAAKHLIGDVFQLAAALGIDRFTIVGHDWGGAIAWGVAMAGQGGAVERAAIVDAPHPAIYQRLLWTDAKQRAAAQYIRAFRDPANDALVREGGLPALLARAITWERPQRMDAEARREMFADLNQREAAFTMLNWYRASAIDVPPMDAPFALAEDYADRAAKLAIPTLVVWAEDDPALPLANIAGLEDWIDDLTLVTLPDTGHFVQRERPEELNAILEDWLAKIEPA